MAAALPPTLNLPDLLDVNVFSDAPRSEEAPRMALDLIDEDPDQPRRQHDQETLKELADSIKAAGDVLQPVSLRPNPEAPGRYIINFGHRRCRAARMAGLPDVPYFVGLKIDSFAQVIENEQRDDLSPLDLALFIRDREAEGITRQDIALRLGKSKGYISKAAALIDPPAVVVEALRTGKVKGVSQAYELRNLHADHPEAVQQWVAQQQNPITRVAIGELRERLEAPVAEPEPAPVVDAPAPATASARAEAAKASPPAKATPASDVGQTSKPTRAGLVLVGEYKGQPLELDLSAKPAADDCLYGRRPGSPRRLTVPAAEVKLVKLVQG